MERFLDFDWLRAQATAGLDFLGNALVDWQLGLQVALIAAGYAAARALDRRLLGLRPGSRQWERFGRLAAQLARALAIVAMPALWLLAVLILSAVVKAAGWRTALLALAANLLFAWVVIRLLTQFVRDPLWSRVLAVAIWTVAALNIAGLLEPVIRVLDQYALTLGEARISVLTLLEGLFVLAVLLGLARLAGQLAQSRLLESTQLSPSAQVLIAKLVSMLLVGVAVVVALDTVGINFGALAVFTGALGLGVGFGLQKVVSNLFSGVILLIDRSIKPGDVIYVRSADGGGTYGWINSLRARYVSVITRDGIEHLIPNDDLITQPVENWSFTDRLVRLRVPVGVSYGSDPRKAMALIVEAANETDRVLAEPAPRCLLMGFGDSAVELELRFWIADAQQGVQNVRSDILLKVWDKFKAEGIQIPFPQRDLHLKSAAVPLRVDLDPGEGGIGAVPQER